MAGITIPRFPRITQETSHVLGISASIGDGPCFDAVCDSGSDSVLINPVIARLSNLDRFRYIGSHGTDRLYITPVDIERCISLPVKVVVRPSWETTLLPIMYFTRYYSITFADKYYFFEPKRDGNIPYIRSNNDGPQPFVEVAVGDFHFPAMFDTGSNFSGVLTPQVAHAINLEEAYPKDAFIPDVGSANSRVLGAQSYLVPYRIEGSSWIFTHRFTVTNEEEDVCVLPVEDIWSDGVRFSLHQDSLDIYDC